MSFQRTCAILVVVLSGLASNAAIGAVSITWSTIDGGGGYCAAGNLELEGTIGQHDAGPTAGAMTGGSFGLRGGFWVRPAGAPAVCGCGDLDADGDVDAVDFSTFSVCFGLLAPSVDCPAGRFFCADLDGSGGVDLVDFSLLSAAFGLAATGSPPDCE